MGYLYTGLKPEHAYYGAWQEYRRRRRLAWIATLSWAPIGLLGAIALLPLCKVLHSGWPLLIWLVLVVGLASAAYHYFLCWRCPQCGQTFMWSWWANWPFTDKCLHCGLDRYAPCRREEQEWEFIQL